MRNSANINGIVLTGKNIGLRIWKGMLMKPSASAAPKRCGSGLGDWKAHRRSKNKPAPVQKKQKGKAA